MVDLGFRGREPGWPPDTREVETAPAWLGHHRQERSEGRHLRQKPNQPTPGRLGLQACEGFTWRAEQGEGEPAGLARAARGRPGGREEAELPDPGAHAPAQTRPLPGGSLERWRETGH